MKHNILEGYITPGRLDRFGSTIASMIALAHADILQLFSGPPEVCTANERRWCIYAHKLLYTSPALVRRTDLRWEREQPEYVSIG